MLRLGKLPPRRDARTLKITSYFTPELPPPPDEVDYATAVRAWPMYANDRVGDCAFAAPGHMVQAWTQASRGADVVIPEGDILAAYSAVTGFDPARPETDLGAYLLDVLKYWRNVGIGGHRIGAFAFVEPTNRVHVKQALHLFGGLCLGFALPLSAQGQDVWDVTDPQLRGPARPGSWGGHAVNAEKYREAPPSKLAVVGYDADGVWVVTWGGVKRMTWAFFEAYCDEAYAIISEDFLNAGVTPAGFDVAALLADLNHLGYLPRAFVPDAPAADPEPAFDAVTQLVAALVQEWLKTEAAKHLLVEVDKAAVIAGLRELVESPWKLVKWIGAQHTAPPLVDELGKQINNTVDGSYPA